MTQAQRQASVSPARQRVRPAPAPAQGRLAPVVSLEAARQKKLVAEYGSLVERLVRQAHSKVSFRFSQDELRSAAWLGLFEAHRRFDHSRGIPFAAFAQHRISGAILDEVRGRDQLARPSRRRARAIEGIRERLTRRLQREPTDFEIARVAGEDLDTFHQRSARQKAQSFLCLEALPAADNCRLTDDESVSALESLCRQSTTESLAQALRALPERHRAIVTMYYQDEKSYREIGALLGVTESRICQILKSIQRQLRETLMTAQA